MGLRQRLSLAVAVLHEPQILILDEPTSGVDPVARDSFWELLVDLSRNQGVTIFVTTHFMNEGMRCDRISLMHAGKVLACDEPQKLIEQRGAASLEDAFIGYMQDAIAAGASPTRQGRRGRRAGEAARPTPPAAAAPAHAKPAGMRLRVGRMLAYTRNETMQILRDPVRLMFAFLGSAVLMLVFGFGITTDVENIRYASYDQDQSPESRRYLEQFAGSPRYFADTPPASSAADALKRLQADDVSVVVEIPPNFGRDFRRGAGPEVLAQVDGAMTFRGDTVEQYVQGVHANDAGRPRHRAADGVAAEVHRRRRVSVHVQPDVRERLFDGAERARAAAPADPGDPDDRQHRAREGARLDDQLLRHADGTARVPGGEAAPLHHDRRHQLRDPDRARLSCLQGPDQGELPDAGAVHGAVRDRDDRHRDGDVDVHQQPGRGRLRHRDPDHRADHPVLRPAAAGLDPQGRRRLHRVDLARLLLHARQPGRLHQGPRASPDDDRSRCSSPAPSRCCSPSAGWASRNKRSSGEEDAAQHPLARAQGDPQPDAATR